MFDEITEEMYEARAEVISDIADYAATEAVYSLNWIEGGPTDVDEMRAIYWDGGRGEVSADDIATAIDDNIGDPCALLETETHTLVLALQSYRYNGAGELYHVVGMNRVGLDTVLARVLMDRVLEDHNGEMFEVVNKALTN